MEKMTKDKSSDIDRSSRVAICVTATKQDAAIEAQAACDGNFPTIKPNTKAQLSRAAGERLAGASGSDLLNLREGI